LLPALRGDDDDGGGGGEDADATPTSPQVRSIH
jgi:hypothetical protein